MTEGAQVIPFGPLRAVVEQYVAAFREADAAGNAPADAAAGAMADEPAIWIDDAAWDEADIPRRPWIAPGHLLRGAVTVLAGFGSAGKSTLALAWGVSCAMGMEFGEFAPREPLRVLVLNAEDGRDEQRRRMSAILRYFRAAPADLAGRLVRVGTVHASILFERDRWTGAVKPTRAMDQIRELIELHRPDVIVFDPLVELHNADESDNGALQGVMSRFRGIAEEFDCAVLLVHHVRKGNGAAVPGDADQIRGASAIVGSARIALTIYPMTEEEAGNANIPPSERRGYFRLDGAKSNYAELARPEWFRRAPHPLANGETVAGAEPWDFPSVWAGMDDATANRVLDGLAGGPGGGQRYTLNRGGRSNARWGGHVLLAMLQCGEAQAAEALAVWARNGTIMEAPYRDPITRKDIPGITVVDALRPGSSQN